MSYSIETSDDDVVVTGMAGRLPKSRNVNEFATNLFDKADLVDDSESRWKHVYENVPRHFGKISDLEKFDAAFFSMLNLQTKHTDPQMRIILEHVYEAIIDAGISPQTLIGSNTGVFVACCNSDAMDSLINGTSIAPAGLAIGNISFYMSNRISYTLGLCGPSVTMDTACSSSGYAFDCAVKYLKSGACDAAIVAGSQLNLLPFMFLEYHAIGVISTEGISRPFDADTNGMVRAEGICAAFLQKRKDAKRIYAQVIHSMANNDGFKKEGSTLPSKEMQASLIKRVYQDIQFDPHDLKVIETHSTSTILGDFQEVSAIDEVFCANRPDKMIIGSVKSNMGHAEAASGMASIFKVLIALESGKFPPNINLNKLREDIPAFAEGRIAVPTEAAELTSPYIAINSFGIGGSNVHIVLKQHSKVKNLISCDERMVLWSGRTEDAVHSIYDDIASRQLDAEHIALLHNSQIRTPDANSYRGFAIFKSDGEQTICQTRNVQFFDGVRRPIGFVYAGMGTQWFKMGQDLMQIPLFAESIEKCHEFLLTMNFNLKSVIHSTDPNIYENFLNSSVGIIAVEIALTNVLFALDIKPDFIIGHSVGEIACSYADGCLTMEEALSTAYYRAKVTLDFGIQGGAMAAVGLHHTELEKILPETIDIACRNSKELTTISGPKESIAEFVNQLKSQHCFAREVASAGIAFHSRYIRDLGEKFRECLTKVTKSPKQRSSKWITTTYPEECDESKLCDAKYQATNYINPVYFEEGSRKLPQNAITIEMSPHGFLQSLLKSTLKKNVYVGLTNKNKSDGKGLFLESIGKIFQLGVDFDISKLYLSVEFPVSRGTPNISSLIKWNHSANHFVPYFDPMHHYSKVKTIFNFRSKEFEFLKHHVIDGKPVVPAAFWIIFAWKQFAKMHGLNFQDMKVIARDFEVFRATHIPVDDEILITSTINVSTGKFEVMEGKSLVAQCFIERNDNMVLRSVNDVDYNENSVILNGNDFYKHVRVLGYQYREQFQQIHEISDDGLQGKIKWNENWVTLLDCFLQTGIMVGGIEKLAVPLKIKIFSIDPILHMKVVNECKQKLKNDSIESEVILPFTTNKVVQFLRCGGVETAKPTAVTVGRQHQRNVLLEGLKFIPFMDSKTPYQLSNAMKICSQIFIDSCIMKYTYKVIEVDNYSNKDDDELFIKYFDMVRKVHNVNFDYKLLTSRQIEVDVEIVKDCDLSSFTQIDIIFGNNCLKDSEFLIKVSKSLSSTGVLISQEIEHIEIPVNFEIIAKVLLNNAKMLIMMKLKRDETQMKMKTFEVSSDFSGWFEGLQQELKKITEARNEIDYDSILLYSYNYSEDSGLLGFFNCLRYEHPDFKIKCLLIDDENAPKFDVESDFYKNQLLKDYSVNVLRNGQWGCYQFITIESDETKEPYKGACYANYSTAGNISSFKWYEKPQSNDDLIRVQYAALNFRDVVYSYGYIPDNTSLMVDCTIGIEFSGVRVKTGEKVIGFSADGGCIASYVDSSKVFFCNVSECYPLEDAATMIVAYLTVYWAFFVTTKIEKGKSILIHSGAGGVGQAALHVAFEIGLEVFTTVGTEEKRKFLLDTFPQLKPKNIGNSRDTSFHEMIMTNTNSKGVDYVLNSLAGDKMLMSINCLGKHGVMLEIGKSDVLQGTKVDISYLQKFSCIKFVALDKFENLSQEEEVIVEKLRRDILAGVLKPIKRNIYDACDISKAIQFMSTGNHIGKILLKIRENENDEATLPINITPRFYCNPDHSYVIVGGLGGIGLELSQWLVSRKCRKLIMSSSRGISNQYQAFKIKYWKSFGVETIISTSDVTTSEGCEELLKTASTLGPIEGIFNLALVLQDGIFFSQTVEAFERVLAPKAVATKHLHEQSLKYCSNLKHFVIYSSISCGRGTPGQTNYGMANSVMERIIEKRYSMGLPAKAIQLGPVNDVGVLSNVQFTAKTVINIEVPFQSIASVLEQHDILLMHPEPIISSTIVFKKKENMRNQKESFMDMLMRVLNIEDRKSISMNSTFSQLGIDSLAGVELMQMIEREYGVNITSSELRSLAISELEAKTMENSNDTKTVIEENNEDEVMNYDELYI